MANSVGFHESEDHLTERTRDFHRALTSLQEELEAIDWYQQRVDAAHDEELRDVLCHARDEEMEHATMILEWIRRHSATFDRALRARLFAEGPIVGREEAFEHGTGEPGGESVAVTSAADGRSANGASTPRATVGSLRENR